MTECCAVNKVMDIILDSVCMQILSISFRTCTSNRVDSVTFYHHRIKIAFHEQTLSLHLQVVKSYSILDLLSSAVRLR